MKKNNTTTTAPEGKQAFMNSGERVTITDKKRNLGHGEQVQVIYSDGTDGWLHPEDLQETDSEPISKQ